MTTFYAAAKYEVHAEPEQQWRQISDLLMVAVELVRIAKATGRAWEAVERVLEETLDIARDEWDGPA